MTVDREFWLRPFPKNHFPNWMCPKCGTGILRPIEKTFSFDESGDVTEERIKHGEYFDYDAYTFRYSVLLKCNYSNCQERVSSCGHGYVQGDEDFYFVEEDGSPVTSYREMFVPEYFYPALNLFPVSEKCPERVATEINRSFKLFFAEPSAAANYVRKAIEEILTNKGVPRLSVGKRSKKVRISLHDRIVIFEATQPDIAKRLFALKWLGNEGSHANTITKNDVLDAYEILEWAIDDLYVGYRKLIQRKVSKINRNRKPLHPST
ncbi:MAG: DUF4145 domain-containing protein [Chloroflexota bacterium]